MPSGWRIGDPAPTSIRLGCGERTAHVHIVGRPADATARVEDGENRSLSVQLAGETLSVTIDGVRSFYTVAYADHQIWLAGDGRAVALEERREAPVRPVDEHSGAAELVSPMPGSVVAVGVSDGDSVSAGTVVVAVEAMKMEHSLTAPVDGVVQLLVAVGDQVKVGQPLAKIIATTKAEHDE